MKRNNFGLWGLELSRDDFARALAALGVLDMASDNWRRLVDAESIKAALIEIDERSHGLLAWRLEAPTGMVSWPSGSDQISPRVDSAFHLAQAWHNFRKGKKEKPRFELHQSAIEDYSWLAEQLTSPAVGDSSLYIRVDHPETTVGWSWPLRVGFLNGEAFDHLRAGIEKTFKASSLRNLVDFVNVSDAGDDCDILLFPQGLRDALTELLRLTWRPRADCVVVLGGSSEQPGQLAPLLQTMRTQARTSGVGILSIPDESSGEWLKGLVAELSHNNPLDVALFRVENLAPQTKFSTPLLAASRRLIDLSLVSRTAERLGLALKRQVEHATGSALTEAEPPPAAAAGPGPSEPTGGSGGLESIRPGGSAVDPELPSGGGFESRPAPVRRGVRKAGGKKGGPRSAPPKPVFRGGVKKNGGHGFQPTSEAIGVANDLASKISDNQWKFESGAATDKADQSRAAQALIKKLPRKSEERLIQAQVFDVGTGRHRTRALNPDASYAVDVQIGPQATGWVDAGEAFPVEDLPPSETGHDLKVVFTEPNVSPDPQVGNLFLPPEGATAPCRFFFHVGKKLEHVRARITVLHRNRVIQTAILDAPVDIAGEKSERRITLEIEARVLPEIGDLKRRQTFDAAIVLNHASDGQSLATAMTGENSVMFSFDQVSLAQTIDSLNGELTRLAGDPENYPEDLTAKETTKLLVLLARHGRTLYQNIFDLRRQQELQMKSKKRIQIVSMKPESNLPLEFLYDYEAPGMNAKLCSFAKKSLPKGECDKACGGLKSRKTVVCPLGFWGLNRVIERHAYDDKMTAEQKSDFKLKSAPGSGRNALQILDKALFAASPEVDRAEKGLIKKVETALRKRTKQTDFVLSWKDWAAKIKSSSPSLLVLLSHTELNAQEDNIEALEIGKLPRLSRVDIEEKYVRKKGSTQKPVVMLIGCKTNAPDNLLHNFVPRFGAFASIVVSTGATVLALQAARVAMEFIEALSKLPTSGDATFGDAMLAMRRQLFAQGLPMVLTLSAYGDADWNLK